MYFYFFLFSGKGLIVLTQVYDTGSPFFDHHLVIVQENNQKLTELSRRLRVGGLFVFRLVWTEDNTT